jgi:DNA-binding IclR family transcriptional regulator
MVLPVSNEDSIELDSEGIEGRSRAPAVARAAAVLRMLSRERTGLRVTEIARRLGLVTSTCFHVLRALVNEGFITFDPDKKTYRTAVGLLTLVSDAMASNDFPRTVQPVLSSLSAEHRVTVVAISLDARDRMVVVAIARSDNIISLHINVGRRFPSLISATGRCVAASSGLSKEKLRARFAKLRWERAPKFEDWYAEVQRAKSDGYAIDRGSFVRGITILATLLPSGPDGTVHGIAAIGFDHVMTEKSLQGLRDALMEAARNTAAQLQ